MRAGLFTSAIGSVRREMPSFWMGALAVGDDTGLADVPIKGGPLDGLRAAGREHASRSPLHSPPGRHFRHRSMAAMSMGPGKRRRRRHMPLQARMHG